MKKSSGIVITLLMILCAVFVLAAPVQAKKNKPKAPKAPKTVTVKAKKVVCTKSGNVKVSFNTNVAWSPEAKAVITDAAGTELTIKSSKQLKRSALYKVEGLQAGGIYKLTISGIKAAKAQEYTQISREFSMKSFRKNIKVKKVYGKKKVISVMFRKRVYYDKEVTVVVTDENGNILQSALKLKNRKKMLVKVIGMQKGAKYTLTINGIKVKKDAEFGSISYTFQNGR